MRPIVTAVATLALAAGVGCGMRSADHPEDCIRTPETKSAFNGELRDPDAEHERARTADAQAKQRGRERDPEWQARKAEVRQDAREAEEENELAKRPCVER